MKEYLPFGQLIAAHGLKGELVLKHDLGKKTSLKGLTAIFIEEQKDSLLPWFIQQATVKNETEVYVKLEGIDSREVALKFLRKKVWLPAEQHKKFAASSAPVSLLGYHIFEQGRDLGEILEVIEQPQQLVCRIEFKGQEAFIPVHEGSLEKIDRRNRRVHLVLPEGLLEIYGIDSAGI